ncbi:MAG: DUF932 domain-containing protein [Candidatus Sedimenticola sp. 20ELBAFRAG]
MLMLHAGAEEIDFAALKAVPVPEATASHVPIPHHRLVDMVRHTLSYYGHIVTEEHLGITPDGMRFFGVLSLQSNYGDYTDQIGLRNSNDKRFPIGISFGSRVFVCDNMAFNADHVIKRKHTANAKRDLPGLVAEVVEPLADARDRQQRTIQLYKDTDVNQRQVDHAIMEMYRQGVINVQRIAEIYGEWEKPSHEAFSLRNAWALFNAATSAMAGRVVANPSSTEKLHHIIDGMCKRID